MQNAFTKFIVIKMQGQEYHPKVHRHGVFSGHEFFFKKVSKHKSVIKRPINYNVLYNFLFHTLENEFSFRKSASGPSYEKKTSVGGMYLMFLQ